MCTSEQVLIAAHTLTNNINEFLNNLVQLIFALLSALIDCAIHAFDCIISDPILLVVFVFCFVYYVHHKYHDHK